MKVRTNALINLWDMWLLYYHFSEIRFHCTHAWNVPALTCRDTWNTCRPASPPSWTPHDLRHVTDTCFSRQVRPSDCQYSQLPHHPHSYLNSVHTSYQPDACSACGPCSGSTHTMYHTTHTVSVTFHISTQYTHTASMLCTFTFSINALASCSWHLIFMLCCYWSHCPSVLVHIFSIIIFVLCIF